MKFSLTERKQELSRVRFDNDSDFELACQLGRHIYYHELQLLTTSYPTGFQEEEPEGNLPLVGYSLFHCCSFAPYDQHVLLDVLTAVAMMTAVAKATHAQTWLGSDLDRNAPLPSALYLWSWVRVLSRARRHLQGARARPILSNLKSINRSCANTWYSITFQI